MLPSKAHLHNKLQTRASDCSLRIIAESRPGYYVKAVAKTQNSDKKTPQKLCLNFIELSLMNNPACSHYKTFYWISCDPTQVGIFRSVNSFFNKNLRHINWKMYQWRDFKNREVFVNLRISWSADKGLIEAIKYKITMLSTFWDCFGIILGLSLL